LRRAAAVFGAALALAAPALASEERTAALERRYLAARDLEATGQLNKAREMYLDVATVEAGNPRRDDALLGLTRIALGASGPEEPIPSATSPAALVEARDRLTAIVEGPPGADAAPEAAYWLALLKLDPRAPFFDPAAAQADLTAYPRLYPGSAFSRGAMLRASELLVESGRADAARQLAFRVLADGAEGTEAAAAWRVMGVAQARAGHAQPALVAFGRSVQSAPDGPQARAAQDLAAIVDRTAFARARGPAGGYVPAGDPIALPGRVTDLAAQADGTLLALLERDGQLVSIGTDGKSKGRVTAMGASAIAVDRYGRTWLAAPGKLLVGDGGTSIPISSGSEVVSIAPTGPLAAWIADADERRVVRLNGDGTIAVTAPLPPRADPVRVAAAADGGVWVLESRGPTLLGYGPGGEQRASVALVDRVEKPVDLRSDALGNAYLLAAKPVAVYVFEPAGKLVLTWEPAVAEPGKEFPRPALLAVDGAGRFALYDARLENVRWWR
jgi:hypothetical protein